jgi:histidinol-phosphate aminotransferase
MTALPKSSLATTPQPKPGILDISPYVAGKSKAAIDGQKILKLSSNENTLGPSPKAIKAFTDHASKLYRYPDASAADLRSAIAGVYGLNAERIVCGSGSDELIGLLVHAYAGEGDEVLYNEYGFLMYKIYAQGNGASPVTAPEKNLTADVNALLARVTERTKILFLANPNNPTGSYIPATELKRLRAELPPHIILAIDGAYSEYADQADYSTGIELVEEAEKNGTHNTVMLRTFSKIYGLSSLRLGWGYFPSAIADVLNRVRGPFNISGAAITTGIAAVEDTEYTAQIKAHNTKWRNWLASKLSKLGLTVYPSIANFILVEFPAQGKTASGANNYLMERGIIPREVAGYGLPLCLRITIGTEEENHAVAHELQAFMNNG